jgi:hypothetical protein
MLLMLLLLMGSAALLHAYQTDDLEEGSPTFTFIVYLY